MDALNAFVDLLPEPSDEDGDAYLAAVRAGQLSNWGMDDQPLTETAEQWVGSVRAQTEAEAAQNEERAPVAVSPSCPLVPRPAASPEAGVRVFQGLPESVSAARSWVAGFFPCPAAAADAAVMTSELVTNAVLYSASGLPGGQFTVTVRLGGGVTRVGVTDQGPAPACSAILPGLGLGLGIVRELADACGADGPDRWFELRTAEVVTR